MKKRETSEFSWGKLLSVMPQPQTGQSDLILESLPSCFFLLQTPPRNFQLGNLKRTDQVIFFCETSTLFPSTERTHPTTLQATYTQEATITGKSHLLLIAGMKKLLNVSAAKRNLKHVPKLAHLKITMGLDFFPYRMEDRIKKHCLPLQAENLKCCLTGIQNSCVTSKFTPVTPVQEKCNCHG